MQPVNIESLDQEGRGVAHADGKTIFILGALPGERVTYVPFEKKPRYEIAQVEDILKAAAARTVPHCRYFGVCGGCSMQHLDYRAQVATKQRVLEDALTHVGKVRPGSILPAIYGQPWGYRHRARFSARYVPKKGGALVGFREKRSSHVTNMMTCEVIPPRISALLAPMRDLINGLSIPTRMPQVELAIGESADVLVFRILEPLDTNDEALFREFAAGHGVRIFLQTRGPDSAVPLDPADEMLLSYTLPEFALDLAFSPTEFTQVNPAVNAVLVRRALAMLEPQPGERIADLFCGLGNFSLAIARRGAAVVGFEGTRGLVSRAAYNSERNGLGESAEFVQADLFKLDGATLARLRGFDRMLVDPPRDGAIEVVKALDDDSPGRIVYVSCNPATLARDAGVLVHTKGYGLTAAGVINMFPHTSHVESIAVFDRPA